MLFGGDYAEMHLRQTKAVAENSSDVSAFPPLPIPLSVLSALCGGPPHPKPAIFPRGLIRFLDDLALAAKSLRRLVQHLVLSQGGNTAQKGGETHNPDPVGK